MGNLSSSPVSPRGNGLSEDYAITRAERWFLAKRCVALLQMYFPDTSLETVLLLPREAFLRHGHMPTFEEAKPHLRPVLSLVDKKKYPMGPGKAVYLSHAQGDHLEKRWVPGSVNTNKSSSANNSSVDAAAKAAAAAAIAAGGAVAVAVAAAAAGAAQAAAGAAIARRASAAGEAADLYATARAFLVENPEFQHIWVSTACMPPRLREQKWRGAVPSAAGSNMFEHLHPGALLACDAVLVAPPERESMAYVAERRERYTDLENYSTSPWKTLEGVIAQLINSVSFYTFRLGKKLVFMGPYPSYPEEPQPSPLDFSSSSSRRSSAPVIGGGHSPLDGRGGGGGLASESPVDRARAAARMLLPRMGWHSKSDVVVGKDHDDNRLSGYGDDNDNGWDRSTVSTSAASVTTASVSDSSGRGSHASASDAGDAGDGSRKRGEAGGLEREGSKVERAVREALDRLEINGSGAPPERNWRGVLQPCFVLRKAREDVEKYSDAQGALKQAMCSMSVSIDQAEEFFVTWKYLGVLGPCATKDRLAVLNLLLFSVSVADGHCCPRRPRDFVNRVLDESLVTPGHLDLWMKDLSPDDSRNILRHVNGSGRKLSVLTVGSSHTAGAGVGSFLKGHPTLKELELEWEGVRDLSSIAEALAEHKSLTRLNLTHNEIGPRGAIQLAGALRSNKSLTELDLRENSLGPKGMKAIADALASNDAMRTLHLQDNAIGDDGVIAMTEALMRNGRLRTVCLDGNQVSEDGAKVICIAIKMNPALKLLSLSRNALPDEAKQKLYDAWSQREVEEGLSRSGMFLEQAAEGTATGREGWRNGLPPVEGVFVSSSRLGPGGGTGGVLVSPTREQRDKREKRGKKDKKDKREKVGSTKPTSTEPSAAGNGNGVRTGVGAGAGGGGDNGGAMMPRFSPVKESFAKKTLPW
eukprot:g8162.t1